MSNIKEQTDAFEAPGQEEVEITVRDKSMKYIMHDVSSDTLSDIFADVRSSDPVKKARGERQSAAKIVAACVWRADGSAITFEEASKFPHVLLKKLSEAALKFNGLNDTDEEVKNG